MLLVEIVTSAIPVPASDTCCGLVDALSLIVKVALRGPTAFGAYDTPIMHDDIGATVTGIAPQVPVPLTANSAESDEFALTTMSELVFPVLLTVKFLVTACPIATFPNASDDVTDIVVPGVEVAVGVAVAVADTVAVAVAVAVLDAVAVAVADTVGVAVTVAVAVAVGDGGDTL